MLPKLLTTIFRIFGIMSRLSNMLIIHGKKGLVGITKKIVDPTNCLSALSARKQIGWVNYFYLVSFKIVGTTKFLVGPTTGTIVELAIYLFVRPISLVVSTIYLLHRANRLG